jgi:NADP-reducing hydrogenase subunit HndB
MERRKESPKAKIVLQYGICSIAAGAKDVLKTLQREILLNKNLNVELKLIGCIGLCSKEPLMDVSVEGMPNVTYCLVTPEKAAGILYHHILHKTIINEWVIPNV